MLKVYHKIIRIAGSVITVEADNVAYNELAEVSGERGTSLAQVIRIYNPDADLNALCALAEACSYRAVQARRSSM